MEYLSGGPIQSWQDCLGGQNLETRLDAASLRSVARSRASRTPPPEKDRQSSRRRALLPGRKAAMARAYGRIATVDRLALRQRRKAWGDARRGRPCAFPERDDRLRGPHGRGGEFSPGSELRGPLCEDGDNAAEVEVAERDGACGTVLVKLNTQVWIWETNTLLLVGFRRSNGK